MHALSLVLLFAPVATLAAPATGGIDDPFDAERPDAALDLGDDAGGYIINGEPATADEWPAAGGLLADGSVSAFNQTFDVTLFMCSSTLIAPDVVMTAAHCVDTSFLEAQTAGLATIEELSFVWSGQADLSMYGLGSAEPLPDDAAIGWDWPGHPDWVGMESVAIGLAENHDIALVFLDEPVLDVPHAYLPTPDEVDQLVEGAPVVIVGWGNQEPVAPGAQPRPGSVAIKIQADSIVGPVGATEFQVGPAFEDGRKCQGDSGGPTFQRVETESTEPWRVVGVTSHAWDETLCEQTGGVDTKVSAYLDWIDAEMRARCADGSRAWCDVPGIVPPPMPGDDLDDGVSDGLTDEEARAGGCACSAATTPGPALGLGVLALLLGLARRRR
jgi:MYXO-CTERM domain-containing protein